MVEQLEEEMLQRRNLEEEDEDDWAYGEETADCGRSDEDMEEDDMRIFDKQ